MAKNFESKRSGATAAAVKNNRPATQSGLPAPTITKDELLNEVKKRAYEIWLERGTRPGSDVTDWLQAEKEIKAKYHIK